MSTRFLHSFLLGAFLTAVAGLLELLCTAASFPYHRDWGLMLRWLPAHLLLGALLGLAAAVLLPMVSSQRRRNQYLGLHLGAVILSLGTTAALFLRAVFATNGGFTWSAWLPQIAVPMGVGAALYGLLYWIAASPAGWRLASFFTPWFSLVGNFSVLVLALLMAWIPAARAPGSPTASTPQVVDGGRAPNVLLVVLDTVAADHLGCYQSSRPTSPALDALAEEGVLFEAAYAAAPWTLPSHASIFTGLHPPSHGTGWRHRRLDDGAASIPEVAEFDTLTLAEELGQRGWQTCGVSDKPWLSSVYGTTQGFQSYFDYGYPALADLLLVPRLSTALQRRLGGFNRPVDKGGERVIDTALDWLGGDLTRDDTRPFFLFLNLNEAHTPYRLPADFTDRERFLPAGTTIEGLEPAYFAPPKERKALNAGIHDLLDQQIDIQQGLYDALILYQDGLLDRLFEGLRGLELMEDTLVIITADHGEEFHQLGLSGHQLSLSEHLLHVPLIMRYPTVLDAGTRTRSLVSLVDLFPTVIDLIEQQTGHSRSSPELEALEGFSLLDLGRGEVRAVRDWVYASYQNPAVYLQAFPDFESGNSFPLAHHMRSIQMLRSGSEKYYRYGDGESVFVDLRLDPDEFATLDTGAAPSNPARAALFDAALGGLRNRMETRRELLLGRRAWRTQGGRSGSRTQAALEKEGYLDAVALDSDQPTPRSLLHLPGFWFERP